MLPGGLGKSRKVLPLICSALYAHTAANGLKTACSVGTTLCDKAHVDLEIRTVHCFVFFTMCIYWHKSSAKDKGKTQQKKASTLCSIAGSVGKKVSLRGLDDSSPPGKRLQPAGAGPRHAGAAGKAGASSVNL